MACLHCVRRREEREKGERREREGREGREKGEEREQSLYPLYEPNPYAANCVLCVSAVRCVSHALPTKLHKVGVHSPSSSIFASISNICLYLLSSSFLLPFSGMLCDQWQGIATGATQIDRLKGEEGEGGSLIDNLTEVCK